jgi:H+/gluconate symporter-like permease
MIVDEKYIFCNIANTTGKNPSDLPVVAPPSARPVISILTPTVTATRTPLRTVSPSPRPPLVTQTDKAIFYSTIIVLVFIGIVIIIIACIAGRRRRVPS